MKFTIATPVRNGMPHIRRCVGSVRVQTGVTIQHLVQDGVSTDGTVEWLGRQQGIDARSEPDEGMYDAINKAWARADGDVLAWLNADEQYLPGALARAQRVLDTHPDVDVVFGDAIIVDPEGSPVALRREIPLRRVYVANGFLYALSCTTFFRRRLFEAGLLDFDLKYRMAGDMDLVLKLLARGVRFMHIPSYLALFSLMDANQCLQPRMEEETAEIRRCHGGLAHSLGRRLVMAGRYCERLWSGCYRTEKVSYAFALDEEGKTRTVGPIRVGFRFSPRIAQTMNGGTHGQPS